MRIARAVARNFKGFESFDETFGDVNVLSGRNAAGKSTALDILCAAFVTDGDRELLRAGTDDGEIRVYLEDEDSTFEVRRTIKAGVVSSAKVTSSNKGRQPAAAAAFLKEIVDTVTLDPIREVMTAGTKEQLRILLETMPLDMEPGVVQEAVGDLVPRLALVKGRATLDTIKNAYDAIYAERRLVNRDVNTKLAHAEELRGSVKGWTAPEGRSWQDVFNDVDQRLQSLVAADEAKKRSTEQERARVEQECRASWLADQTEIEKDYNKKLRELDAWRADQLLDVQARAQKDLGKISEVCREMISAIDSGSQEERERLTTEKTRAQQSAQSEAQVGRTNEIASKAEAEAATAKQKSARMTEALKKLDEARDQLLAKLPIKGLKVEGGAATLNGVALGELNTAEQAKFWIKVAVLRAMSKDLGVVVIDHAECFDDVNLPLLIEACRDSGLQFFIGKVAPHDFKIQRYESTVAA